jgi:DNA-directed RNA polymerase specialized sigma24 family protein
VTSEQVQFQEFFAAHYTRLRRLGYRLTGSWMEAEDLAQEAMVRTFWRWRIVRGHDRPEEYARKVLVNRHRSLLRRALVPTGQHTNLPPLVEGPAVRLASRHAKVKREGYRKRQVC